METETTTAVQVLDTFNITEDVKKDITASFEPYLDGLKDLLDRGGDIEIESEDQKDDMAEARSIRLNIQKRRTGMDKAKKKDKEQYMIPANAYDAVYRFIKGKIEPVEKHLKEQEKFAERLEAKRLDELVEGRLQILSEYEGEFIVQGLNLREMHTETFSQLIDGFESQRKERLAKEAEQKEARIAQEKADAEEKEEKDAEIAKLKKDAEDRDLKAEVERVDREAKEADEKFRQDAILAEERKKNEELQKKIDEEEEKKRAKEKTEQEAGEAIERQEQKEKEKIAKEERQSAMAPDKEKLLEFAEFIKTMKYPIVREEDAAKIFDEARRKIHEVALFITERVEEL